MRVNQGNPPLPAKRPARVLLIDNYDSFTFNLVQALGALGASVTVVRNDARSLEACLAENPTHLILSPGPGRPENAGLTVEIYMACAGQLPVLGVCLGHQAIAFAHGATIVPARALMHGKASELRHEGRGLFEGRPEHLLAGRYHSLAVDERTLPEELRVEARTGDGELMALSHREHPTFGLQFHPESILTPEGPRLLERFLQV